MTDTDPASVLAYGCGCILACALGVILLSPFLLLMLMIVRDQFFR